MADDNDFCIIQLDGWENWWTKTRKGQLWTYISIVIFFLSAVLAHPIARSIFFLTRKFSPKAWMYGINWPDDAKQLMMWQTALMCRVGLFWIALVTSRLSVFLCQWPSWLFGICFIIWMDAAANVLREIIVRKGIVGYSEDEKAGRLTLLYEGTTLAKILLLVFLIYTYYLTAIIGNDDMIRLLCSTGFFLAAALAVLPLLRNVMGGHYMFLANMLHLQSRIHVQGSSQGTIADAPLGFIVLRTEDNLKTFVPAGGTVITTTQVYHCRLWPLDLDIRLPPHLSSAKVRRFLQDLDQLLLWDSRFAPFNNVGDSGASSTRASFTGVTERSHVLLNLKSTDEQQLLERARVHESTLALKPETRWVVCFHTFIRDVNQSQFRQVRAAYIEAITTLIEKQNIGYSSARSVLEVAN